MCGIDRDQSCNNSCMDKIGNILKNLADSLKESYATARGEILLEFGCKTRCLKARENELISELESIFNKKLLIVEKFIGLLEYAKTCNPCESRHVLIYVQEQMKSNFGNDKGDALFSKLSFKCDKMGLERQIFRFGKLDRQDKDRSEKPTVLDEDTSMWLAPERDLMISKDRVRECSISSGKTDLESFEILEMTSPIARSCNWSLSDKTECPSLATPEAPLFPALGGMTWLSRSRSATLQMPCKEEQTLFPALTRDLGTWLHQPETGGKRSLRDDDDDLETKMEALALKQEKERCSTDIDLTSLRVTPCKTARKGEPLCKLLGGCAFRLASDAVRVSSKPCVRAWLAHQQGLNTDPTVPPPPPPLSLATSSPPAAAIDAQTSESSVSAVIDQLRRIGASKTEMWLSSVRQALSDFEQPVLNLQSCKQRENWQNQWLLKGGETQPMETGDELMDSQTAVTVAKKSKLANLLLDNQENLEADIEAILYRSPFNGRATNPWLQSNKSSEPAADTCNQQQQRVAVPN